VDGEAFMLTVELFAKGAPDEPVVSGVFNGRLTGPQVGPLEFELERNGTKVAGAITVTSAQ
jgi:hypothetical protein